MSLISIKTKYVIYLYLNQKLQNEEDFFETLFNTRAPCNYEKKYAKMKIATCQYGTSCYSEQPYNRRSYSTVLLQYYIMSEDQHCVKSVRIRSFSGPYFPAFGLHTDQKNSEYRHFSHSEHAYSIVSQLKYLKKSYSLLFFVIFQPRHSISIKSIQHFFVFFVFTLRY